MRRHRAGLVIAWLAGPVIWIGHFAASYFLVTLACAAALPAPRAWLLGITALALLASAWFGVRAVPHLRSGADAVPRFLALGAVWLTAAFACVLLLEGLPFLTLSRWCTAPAG